MINEIQSIVDEANQKIQEIGEKERQSIIRHKAGRDGRLTVSWVNLETGKVRDDAVDKILALLGIKINHDVDLTITQEEIDQYRRDHNMRKIGDSWFK